MRSLLLLALLPLALADIYLHTPRGSNNRLDEANRERNNGNRLFDSQNNNRGGVNVGRMTYYSGSVMEISWTAQHGCGAGNDGEKGSASNCNIVVDMMCDERLRDGTTTRTIPDKPSECHDFDCDTDVRYGRHESYSYYQRNKYTSRNKGIFLANQNLNGASTRFTRQNPNGARSGYEIPEERDYFPWWNPSPWMTLAVFTDNPTQCREYARLTQNTNSRYQCDVPHGLWIENKKNPKKTNSGWIPITQVRCEQVQWFNDRTNQTEFGKWTEVAAHGIPPPECHENQYSRVNHLGAGLSHPTNGYNLTYPTLPEGMSENCAVRVRYNISTGEFNLQQQNDHSNGFGRLDGSVTAGRVNSELNKENGNRGATNEDPDQLPLWEKYGLTRESVQASFDSPQRNSQEQLTQSRDYVHKNNPRVDPFSGWLGGQDGVHTSSDGSDFRLKFQLAVNTAQFGRTFQDRTHRLVVKPWPEEVPADRIIYNLEVRGKRGNIVQTFPSTEYDFTPNRLHVTRGDYLHVHWTGSNTNPNNNDGQGKQGTDRSNIVPLRPVNYDERGVSLNPATPTSHGHLGNSYPAMIRVDEVDDATEWARRSVDFLGWDFGTLARLATNDHGGEQSELDDAGTEFDLGPKQVTKPGTYQYMCSRNNNFSNRSQKGVIIVDDSVTAHNLIGVNGGQLKSGKGQMVVIDRDTLLGLEDVSLDVLPQKDSASPYTVLEIPSHKINTARPVHLMMRYETAIMSSPHVFVADSVESDDWQEVKEDVKFYTEDGQNMVDVPTTHTSAVFVVKNKPAVWVVLGVIVGVLLFVAAVFLGIRWRKQRHVQRRAPQEQARFAPLQMA